MLAMQKYTPETINEIVGKYFSGVPAPKLAETYGCGVSSVYFWAKTARYEQFKTAPDLTEENRKLKELLYIFLKEHLEVHK